MAMTAAPGLLLIQGNTTLRKTLRSDLGRAGYAVLAVNSLGEARARLRVGQYHLVVCSDLQRSVTWADAEWMIKEWGGPFAIKGVMTAADAKRARSAGATAVMLSNHGGRQLDFSPAPVDTLEPIVEAVGGDLEIIVDGGIRRGVHVLKALALGATACSGGRPYLYGLGAGGERGVAQALKILRTEIERDMALLGCARLKDLDATLVRKVAGAWAS